jgi:hypothetical protein
VGPVLTRLWGGERLDVGRWANAVGPVQLEASRTLFVAPLNLGRATLGSLGFVLSGTFSDGGAQVQALVETMAETFDSALMSFMALVDGRSALEHLDELWRRTLPSLPAPASGSTSSCTRWAPVAWRR